MIKQIGKPFTGDAWVDVMAASVGALRQVSWLANEQRAALRCLYQYEDDDDGVCGDCGSEYEANECTIECDTPKDTTEAETLLMSSKKPLEKLEAELQIVLGNKAFDPAHTKVIECCCACYGAMAVTRIKGDPVLLWAGGPEQPDPYCPGDWHCIPLVGARLDMLHEFLRISRTLKWEATFTMAV